MTDWHWLAVAQNPETEQIEFHYHAYCDCVPYLLFWLRPQTHKATNAVLSCYPGPTLYMDTRMLKLNSLMEQGMTELNNYAEEGSTFLSSPLCTVLSIRFQPPLQFSTGKTRDSCIAMTNTRFSGANVLPLNYYYYFTAPESPFHRTRILWGTLWVTRAEEQQQAASQWIMRLDLFSPQTNLITINNFPLLWTDRGHTTHPNQLWEDLDSI